MQDIVVGLVIVFLFVLLYNNLTLRTLLNIIIEVITFIFILLIFKFVGYTFMGVWG